MFLANDIIEKMLGDKCLNIYVCICVYVYMCICVYVYMCLCVYIVDVDDNDDYGDDGFDCKLCSHSLVVLDCTVWVYNG